MFIVFLVLSLCLQIFALPTQPKPDKKDYCSIDIQEDLTLTHPLILQHDLPEFLMPNVKSENLIIPKGDSVRLVCAGKDNYIDILPGDVQEIDAICISEQTFLVNGTEQWFKDLTCTKYPEASAQRTGNQCGNRLQYTEIEIGFKIDNNGFLSVITSCFDESSKDSLYSMHKLTQHIDAQQRKVPRPKNFNDAGFYDDMEPRPHQLYTRKYELTGFGRLLHSEELATKYISLKTNYFLSKGHFAPKADFLYAAQQRATFFYVNVAPQWETFNGKNWDELEVSCRKFASDRQLNLIVYTGAFGNASLPNADNVRVNLSLNIDNVGNNVALNVPEVYWKVLYEPNMKAGIAFVGHNNPYETNVEDRMICSENVCDQINWLSWNPDDSVAGYSYCCHVQDLKRTVANMPDIQVDTLLT